MRSRKKVFRNRTPPTKPSTSFQQNIEDLKQGLENFKLLGLPSLREIQNQVEALPENANVISLGALPNLRVLEEKNKDLNQAIVESFDDIKELLENSTSDHIDGLKSRVEDFNEFQLSAISLLVNMMSTALRDTTEANHR